MHLTRRHLIRASLLAPLAAGALLRATGAAAADAPSGPASTPPPEVAALPGARLQGQMRFRWFGLHVYDGRLWSATPIRADDYPAREFALELIYARNIPGADIAERTLSEMRRIAEVTDAQAKSWLDFMRDAFPDVKPGDRLMGLHRPGQGVSFFHNGRPTRALADVAFPAQFFGIWLSPRSREPALRDALLGRAP
jgi:Chalcone isomerase-like